MTDTEPAGEYERVRISELKEDPDNARVHPDENIEAIKSSLNDFGQRKPIVVDMDNNVVAGNGTLTAAKALGWEYLDVSRTTLKGPQAKAYALSDNRSSELATWDLDCLQKTLKELDTVVELENLGWTTDELAALDEECTPEELGEDEAVHGLIGDADEPGKYNVGSTELSVKFEDRQLETVLEATEIYRRRVGIRRLSVQESIARILREWMGLIADE